MLDVLEKPVAHGLDHGFRRHGVCQAEEILTYRFHERDRDYCQRHYPQVLSEVGKAAAPVNQPHYRRRIIRRCAADGVVYRSADYLRDDHVGQRHERRRDYAHREQRLAALQKAPYQSEITLFFCILFRFHKSPQKI